MKLIIINGTSGVGKSTLAKKLHKKLNFAYLLDVDQIRYNFSNAKNHRDDSRLLSFKLSLKTVDFCLRHKLDIIVNKMMYESESNNYNYLEQFIDLGKQHEAGIIEIILHAKKETVLNHLAARGYTAEHTNTPEIAEHHWENFEKYRPTRNSALAIDVNNLNPDEVFNQVMEKIKPEYLRQ